MRDGNAPFLGNPDGSPPVAVGTILSGRSKRTADGFRDFKGPISRYVGVPRMVPTPQCREGMALRADEVNAWAIKFAWAHNSEAIFMNIVEELKGHYEEAATLWSAYEKRLQEFRSAVKNDISSLEAGARRTTESVTKMNKAYGEVIGQLNAPEMMQAIDNAERLARAMEALANLQSHKLTFAVIDAQAHKS